jgi:thiamine transport system substrate-binding protein
MKRIALILILVTATLASACTPQGPVTLTVMTHDSFAASQPVIAAFEQANNVKVVFLKSGDAGTALNKAILSKEAPLADVFYGVDNTFLSRALDAGIYEPYASPFLAKIPAVFQLDSQSRALPVDYGDICLNYDKAYFNTHGLPLPVTLDDLLKPEYKGLLVVENPAISSPGLAFLLATIVQYGDPGYLGYWESLRANGLVVVDDWNTAYYTNFSGSSGRGPQPLVLSYNTSPAAEVVFASTPLTDAPTASILGSGTCFRQVEFVGILKGTKHLALAQKFVDFMLGQQFQEDIPLQMFMYPVNSDAGLPQEFIHYAQVAAQPATLDPAAIAAGREQWIADWTKTVLR